jgi:oligogalacturonide transport system permease protein
MGMKASNAIATFFKYFVLILVGLIMIYPLLWMISATFKDNSEIFAGIGLWIKNPTLEGYKNALNNFGGSINILQAMLNTYSYVLPKVICTVVSSCIAAYGFGRFDFPGRKILFSIMLATLFLPQVVLNVPQFLLYTKFGWVNSPFYLAIWVHCAFATETYFVYQLVQFMRNVPRDLDHRRLLLLPDPVQGHRPDADARSGVLRTVPVHVELQRLHGSPALRPDPCKVPHVPVRQAVHGR